MTVAERRQHRRQHLDADDFAGADAHRAAHTAALSGRGPQQGSGVRGQLFGMGPEIGRRFRRDEPLRRADEQLETDAGFQRIDMPADGRLRQAQFARGG
jgi:hypothetical protein